MPAALTRDDWAAAAIGALCLAMLAHAALAAGVTSAWVGWSGAALMFVLLVPAIRERLRLLVAARPAWRMGAPLVLVAAGLAGAFAAGAVPAARLLLWPVCVVAAVLVVLRGEGEPTAWHLLAAAVLIGAAAGMWDRSLRLAIPNGPRIGFTFFSAIALASFLFGCVRPLATFDLRLALRRSDLVSSATGIAAILAVGLPLGLVTEFVVWDPNLGSPHAASLRLLSYSVFIGLPEEMLFRGLVQEGLGRWRSPRFGWIAGSLLFGLAHLGRATGLTDAQRSELFGLNWRLAVLAAVAGLGYGWVYRRTGRIGAAALTHGAVNWIWSGLFIRG